MSSAAWEAVRAAARQAQVETCDDRLQAKKVCDDLLDLPYGWETIAEAMGELVPYQSMGGLQTPDAWPKLRKALVDSDVKTIGTLVMDAINAELERVATDALEDEGRND